VPENSNTFYVNDRLPLDANDSLTTATGDNRNTGKVPSAPKPYPNNVLRSYRVGPGDTVLVDAGSYSLVQPIRIANRTGREDDEGFTLTGPNTDHAAVTFALANPTLDAAVVELSDADFHDGRASGDCRRINRALGSRGQPSIRRPVSCRPEMPNPMAFDWSPAMRCRCLNL
jgi:hypothetical protein